MELPVDSKEERDLVLVDLLGVEPRDLAPGTSRVVAILQIFGCEDKSSEEHATPALKSAVGVTIIGLLRGEVVLGHMGFNKDKIIKSYLEGRVAGARAAKSLLDEGSERQDRLATKLAAANHRRERPDCLDDLCRRICQDMKFKHWVKRQGENGGK